AIVLVDTAIFLGDAIGATEWQDTASSDGRTSEQRGLLERIKCSGIRRQDGRVRHDPLPLGFSRPVIWNPGPGEEGLCDWTVVQEPGAIGPAGAATIGRILFELAARPILNILVCRAKGGVLRASQN